MKTLPVQRVHVTVDAVTSMHFCHGGCGVRCGTQSPRVGELDSVLVPVPLYHTLNLQIKCEENMKYRYTFKGKKQREIHISIRVKVGPYLTIEKAEYGGDQEALWNATRSLHVAFIEILYCKNGHLRSSPTWKCMSMFIVWMNISEATRPSGLYGSSRY